MINNWKNNNLFLEFRYSPVTNFFNKKEEIFQKLFEFFPIYNLQNLDTLYMHTLASPGINVNLQPNRFLISSETPNDFEGFIEFAFKTWFLVFSTLDIKTIDRVGMRLNAINEMSILDANEKMKPFICKDIMSDEFKIATANISMNLTYNDNNIFASFNVGNSQSINFNAIQGTTILPISSGIIADIDFSKENINSDNIRNLLVDGMEATKKCLLMIK